MSELGVWGFILGFFAFCGLVGLGIDHAFLARRVRKLESLK